MKKAAAILFAMFYLFSAVGFAINIHYCGSHIYDIALIDKADSCCGKDHCCNSCEDKTVVIQNVKSELIVPVVDFDFNGLYKLNPLVLTSHIAVDDESEQPCQWVEESSPPGIEFPILYCSLTYYG